MAIPKKFRFLIAIVLLIGFWFILPYYLRTAFLHLFPGIDDYQLFDNRIVQASETPYVWPMAKDYNTMTLADNWIDTLDNYHSVAYLVIQNDSILYEEYWDTYGPDSYSNSFSAAKSIVSLLIGAAIDDGSIDSVGQKVSDYIPRLNEGLGAELTIRDLLTMSSGSNWEESYTGPFSMTTKAYYGNNLEYLTKDIHVVEEPGKIFSYQSGNTQLLSQILRKSTQQELSDYASKKLWEPIGAHESALWSLDKPGGVEKAYCCFNSNARDFALLGNLIVHEGFWRGKQIISRDYIKEATTAASYLKTPEGKPVDFYGFQYWIVDYRGMKIPYARGILGQYIISIPEKNAVIVRLGHSRSKVKINNHPSDVFAYLDMGFEILK